MNNNEKKVKDLIENHNVNLNQLKNELLENFEKTTSKVITQSKNNEYHKSYFEDMPDMLYEDVHDKILEEVDNSKVYSKINKMKNTLKKKLLYILQEQTKIVLTKIEILLESGRLEDECILLNEINEKEILNLKIALENLSVIDNLDEIENFSLPYIYSFTLNDYCVLDNIVDDIKFFLFY